MAKRGYNRDSNIDAAIEELDKEISKMQEDAKAIISQDHYQEIYDYIVRKKKEMNIVGKSIESRIDEFKNTNYVMQYPFDPTVQLPNNELPNPQSSKIAPTSEEDDVEIFELEAEALELELMMQ